MLSKKLIKIFAFAVIGVSSSILAQNGLDPYYDVNGVTSKAASNTMSVSVPATAGGNFGTYPNCNSNFAPLVKSLTVTKAGTFTINASGTWNGNIGPNGIYARVGDQSLTPLEQGAGLAGTEVSNYLALMGAFVPQSDVNTSDFQASNQLRMISGVGIMPNKLFFVGSRNSLQVSGPGTLYFGINDWCVIDNYGSLTVQVKFTPNL